MRASNHRFQLAREAVTGSRKRLQFGDGLDMGGRCADDPFNSIGADLGERLPEYGIVAKPRGLTCQEFFVHVLSQAPRLRGPLTMQRRP